MKNKLISLKKLGVFLALSAAYNANAQSVTTTTITGDLRVNRDFESAGEVVVLDTIRAKKDVIIDGNATIGGNLKVSGDAFFNNSLNLSSDFGIGYTPANGATPRIITFSPFSGASISDTPGRVKGCSTFNVSTVNSFSDLLQVYNQNGSTLSMGVLSGNNEGIISLEATNPLDNGNGGEELSINPRCSVSVNMCYGGGFVTVAKNLEIGKKTRDSKVALNIINQPGISQSILVQDLNAQKQFEVLNTGSTTLNIGGTDVNAFTIKNASNSQTVFQVLNSGKTFIGDDRVVNGPHTDAMLSVGGNGKVACKEVRVFTVNWADHVFDNNYKLLPLLEVEKFYTANKHLPNVPTTADIVKEGNDLAKTDAMLLEKIEELTLYIVELKKEINELKSK